MPLEGMMVTDDRGPLPLDQVRGWFFDLDGTLMDTDDEAVEALARRFGILGRPKADRLARRLVMLGETPMNRAMTLLDAVGLDRWAFGLRRRLSRRMRPTFRIIQGIKPLVEHLAGVGRLAVVSTRSREDAMAFLDQHSLTEFFSLVVTQESTKRLKPHAEPVLHAARELGLSPDLCVMVGDTPVDILSARRAGSWAVGVLCGFGEEDELWRAGAHLVLPSTADLYPLVLPSE
ncbi:MAG: HAD family hydrolase [Anaerolineae bacterium]